MNNQFLTQFLREDQDEVNKSIENLISQTGADKDIVDMLMNAIRQGILTPERAIDLIRDTFKNNMSEDGMGGGSTTGGGVTNGASFTPGNGEQYAMGSKKISRKKLGEEDGSDLTAVDVTGKAYSIGDIIEYKGHKFECQIGQRGIAALQHVDDQFNPLPEFYEGGTPQFTAILKNAKIISGKGGLSEGGEFKVGDQVKHENQDWKIEKDLGHSYRLKSLKGLPSVNIDKKVLDRENSGVKTEDAPRLAGEPSKTDKGGARNLSAYTKDGFTKAPSAEEAAKTIKGVEVKDLWGKKALGENYYSFRNETKTRGKSDQFHEAVKIINKKLDEVNRLLEFTGTLKTELSESEDTFEIKTNTKKSMDKVRGKVIEAYQKLKQL